jgi:hypothetical protein
MYCVSTAVLAHAAEANFWTQRRRAARGGAGELAQLPLSVLTHKPLDFLRGGAPFPVAESTMPTGSSAPLPEAFQAALGSVAPYGSVREVHISQRPGAPLVIHIQDAHGIVEAQRNIAGMIAALADSPSPWKGEGRGGGEKERVPLLVGVEGAAGPFNLGPYRDWPDAEAVKKVADYFLVDGTLGGPEFAALTSPRPPVLWGVEDPGPYLANVAALKASFAKKQVLQKALSGYHAAIAKLKTTFYSRELKEFDTRFQAYQDGRETLAAYMKFLGAGSSPNLRLLHQALTAEESLDFKVVERERRSLADRLARGLPKTDLDALVHHSLEHRAGALGYGDYYRHVESLCRRNRVALDDLPQFKAYMAYVRLAESINRDALLDEIPRRERHVADGLALTPEQKKLVALTRRLALLDKLSTQAMSPQDWVAYENERHNIHRLPRDLRSLPLPSAGEGRGGGWFESILAPFENFCSTAVARNTALVNNLTRRMERRNISSAVLVAGGFHTEGITRLLKEGGVSYMVVAPKITEIPKDDHYLDIFARDPLPLEKMFTGEKIFLKYPAVTARTGLFDLLRIGFLRLKIIALLHIFSKEKNESQTVERANQAGVPLRKVLHSGPVCLFMGAGILLKLSEGVDNRITSFPPTLWDRLRTWDMGLWWDGVMKHRRDNPRTWTVEIFPKVETVLLGVGSPFAVKAAFYFSVVSPVMSALWAAALVGTVFSLVHVLIRWRQGTPVSPKNALAWIIGGTLLSLPFTFVATGMMLGSLGWIGGGLLLLGPSANISYQIHTHLNAAIVDKQLARIRYVGPFLAWLFEKPLTMFTSEDRSAPPAGNDPRVVRNSREAYSYEDPSQRFSGVDIEHFISAQSLLNNGSVEYRHSDWIAALSGGDSGRRAVNIINGDNYSDPRLEVEIAHQSDNPRDQGVNEAVANSLDAMGFEIGKRGKGVKQLLDWLEPTGRDRLDVLTREGGGDLLWLTLLKDRKGQTYIQMRRADAEEAREFWGSAMVDDQGTSVRVTVAAEIPATDAETGTTGRNSQQGILESVHRSFAYVTGVTITTQREGRPVRRVNGFKSKRSLVPFSASAIVSPEDGREISVETDRHSITIRDNGQGMDVALLSNMFVPKQTSKLAHPLSDEEAQAEPGRVTVINDTSLPRGVSIASGGRVAMVVDVGEGLVPDAVHPDGLAVDLGRLVDIFDNWKNIHLPVALKRGGLSHFDRGILYAVEGLLSAPESGDGALSPEEKVRLINTLVLALDALVRGNDLYAESVKNLRAHIKRRLAPVLDKLTESGWVLLPHEAPYAKLAVQEGRRPLYLQRNLFNWEGPRSVAALGGRRVQTITLGGDRRLSLMVTPFVPTAVEGVGEYRPGWETRPESDRLPVVKDDDFIAIPPELGARLLELDEKRSAGPLTPAENREFLYLAQNVNDLTAEEVATNYENFGAPRNMNIFEPDARVRDTGQFDSAVVEGFLTRAPIDRAALARGLRSKGIFNGKINLQAPPPKR